MLIPSERHRRSDLALWEEHEAADAIHGATAQVKGRIEASLSWLVEFLADDRPAYAATSWGKDSVVLCHLLWRVSRDVPLVHLRPTNHNPDCDTVRDAYFLGFPGQPYEEIVVDYSDIDRRLPDHEVDRLTDQRWYAAITRSERRLGGRHILGIRSDESYGRMLRTLRWGVITKNTCAPLAHWSTADVFGYLAVHDLPVHPAYAMLGSGRWPRERIRVAEIGDTHGKGGGRREWEQEYYGDVLRRLEATSSVRPCES